MRRLALIGIGLTLALLPASAASAQGDAYATLTFSAPGARVLDQTDLQVAIRGAVAVEYHGSPAAGCARLGLCDVSGNITWDPGRSGVLTVEKYVQQGQRRLAGYLITGSQTAAEVTRLTPGGQTTVCGDAEDGLSGLSSVSSRSLAALSLRLVDSGLADFTTTRCAGPLGEDLVKLLPVRPLARSVLDGKSTKLIDLSTTRPFSVGGFAGTLRSSVVLRVGPKVKRPRTYEETLQELNDILAKYRKPVRALEARYKVSHVGGTLAVAFHGAGQCADLDSCGASGTTEFQPNGSKGELELDAYLPMQRPWRDLRTAFGLAHGGRLKGARVTGYGYWRSSSGTLASSVAHADGGPTCTDTVPVRTGDLYVALAGDRLLLSYDLGGGFGEAAETRCPGPLMGELPLFQTLAQGSVPVSVLKHRRITAHLKLASAPFSAPGYLGTTQQDLTVTLRRVGVRTRKRTLPF